MVDEEFIKYKIQAAEGNSGGQVFKEEEEQVYMVEFTSAATKPSSSTRL